MFIITQSDLTQNDPICQSNIADKTTSFSI